VAQRKMTAFVAHWPCRYCVLLCLLLYCVFGVAVLPLLLILPIPRDCTLLSAACLAVNRVALKAEKREYEGVFKACQVSLSHCGAGEEKKA
jgi:hypothetical protein